MRELVVGGACGLLVGVAVGWLVRGDAPPAAPVAVEPPPAARASVGRVAPAPAVTGDDCAALVAAQDAQIRQLSELAFGRPLVWPDGVAASVEADIRAAVAECDPRMRLVGVDCSEPPCMVSFANDGDTSFRVGELCPALQGPLANQGSYLRSESCPDGSTQAITVMAIGQSSTYGDANPAEDVMAFLKNLETRKRVRSEDLQEDVACP